MDMSIENMTTVSYFMFAISGISAAAAVVLFFALDIAKCWRMTTDKHLAGRKKQQKIERTAAASKAVTESIRRSEETVPLISGLAGDEETFLLNDKTAGETVLLGCAERTEALGTVSLEMIQDIVYMQDTVEIGQALGTVNK